ncbi:MAG: DNA repair protein RadA [Elusimicrobia bacterium]|nr:DNA repair protein RadA [Elusimicrobiota bacterium]
MMTKSVYRCRQCARESARWMGQCPSCESWNSFEQAGIEAVSGVERRILQRKRSGPALHFETYKPSHGSPVLAQRRSSGFSQMDEGLGGGFLDGSLILLGGAPGIGKSTLMGHIAGAFASARHEVLYVSGEEDTGQVISRLDRLAIKHSEKLFLADALTLEDILLKAGEMRPRLLVIDSVQTLTAESLDYPAGSPALIRSVAGRLMALSKREKMIVVLLGHVTKEGVLAGPRHLEHMVDVVLQMEKPRNEDFRLLRVTKNRFGPTNAMAVFEMKPSGLTEVADPSESFISGHWRERLSRQNERIGLASSFAMDAGKVFLIQAEALVGKKKMVPGKRSALGIDRNRLEILVAVLERALGVNLETADVFLSLIGGIRLKDPGVDLALIAALGSAVTEAGVPTHAAFLGEVSLSGDVLPPRDLELRLKQAKALGFKEVHTAAQGRWHVKDFLSLLRKGGA